MLRIDLNCDLGESFGTYVFGDDAAVLSSVSSANIACGFHAGDPRGIRETCAAAARAGAAIGAHPGYRDLAGFGRRFIEYDPGELTDELIYQIGAVQALARSVGSAVRYVKPHGALYNAIVRHEPQAEAVARAVREIGDGLPMLVPPGSVIERVARDAGMPTYAEAFADRAYTPDGALAPRTSPGAVLTADAAIDQAVRIATTGRVVAVDGSEIAVQADSICLHGDRPEAVGLSREIRAALEDRGIEIASFV
ncbi:LamB/YcsF family protein [Leucobacter sp. USCH14]|uniref:LamB/YcsF family protein n=1 Tax=Leucobacter sp. USCH14 TaxID=3024838 RepID=UPI00309EB3A1